MKFFCGPFVAALLTLRRKADYYPHEGRVPQPPAEASKLVEEPCHARTGSKPPDASLDRRFGRSRRAPILFPSPGGSTQPSLPLRRLRQLRALLLFRPLPHGLGEGDRELEDCAAAGRQRGSPGDPRGRRGGASPPPPPKLCRSPRGRPGSDP